MNKSMVALYYTKQMESAKYQSDTASLDIRILLHFISNLAPIHVEAGL